MRCSLLPYFLPLLLFSISSFGQSDGNKGMARKGLLRTQGGFSVGTMLGKGNTVHLDGTLAYYLEDRFSYRGDLFHLLYEASEVPFEHYYSFFSGLSYHFREEANFDPYVGFQPGLGYSHYVERSEGKAKNSSVPMDARDESFEPLLSGVAGVQYYGPAVFHLLLECRYVHATHLSKFRKVSLNEFRFVFGLGLNLNILDPFFRN